jgi:hypothetical protein
MLILALAILGLLGIAAAFVAMYFNRRRAASGLASRRWLIARRWSWLVGLLLGIGGYFIAYPMQDDGGTWRVIGFPFIAAAIDPQGADYVSVTTMPAVIGNFLFFLLLPQLVLWIAGRGRNRAAG